jgi:hypothetical protein
MADPAELPDVTGLTPFLQTYRAVGDLKQHVQQQGLQNEFIRRRAELGPNASPEALTGLALQYGTPTELIHFGLASEDKKAALVQHLTEFNRLAQYRLDDLERKREESTRRLTDKEAQDAVNNSFKKQSLDLQQQVSTSNETLKKLGIDIQQQNADTNRMRVENTVNKNDEPLLNFIDKIDATKRMIQQNPEAVGGRGMLNRGAEFVGSMLNPGQETPASNLQSQILDLQTNYRGLPGHAASRLKVDASKIDSLIKGLGTFTAPDQAIGSLDTLRDTVSKQLRNPSVATPAIDTPEAAPEGTPQFPPAPLDPTKRVDGVPYTTPKGVLRWNGKSKKWLVP